MSNDDFAKLSDAVYQITGISIKEQRRTMLEGRLRRRLLQLKLADYSSYLSILTSDEDEKRTFTNLVTTNETYFYRTPRVWDFINDKKLVGWREENRTEPFRAWSAASSTGEEAHTLGIMLEDFRQKHPGFDYDIHGTDIATSVVEKASAGNYNGRSIARFRESRPELFQRYMTGSDADGYSVLPDIRRRIRFETANLFRLKPSSVRYDLILLRNVLIYFTKPDQAAVMARIHDRLAPGGIVIIGESESLNYLDTMFDPIEHTIYRSRRDVSVAGRP